MTQYEIIKELYELSMQKHEIDERMHVLIGKLSNHDGLNAFIKAHHEISEKPDEPMEPASGIESNIMRLIETGKSRNCKGMHASIVRNFDETYKKKLYEMIDDGKISIIRVKTNYYYIKTENAENAEEAEQ